MTSRRVLRAIVAIVVAGGFFVLALSDELYRDTSPTHIGATLLGSQAPVLKHSFGLSLHVVLRKAYSIIAFAIVGIFVDLALAPSEKRVLRMALLIALYSAAIEAAQWFKGSLEGPFWNAVDVACGGVGGAIGAAVARTADRLNARNEPGARR